VSGALRTLEEADPVRLKNRAIQIPQGAASARIADQKAISHQNKKS
jgi:hypothetical protein